MMSEHLDRFMRLTGNLAYRPKAVFPSELFLFYCWSRDCEVDHIIETGIGYGGSTEFLAHLFGDKWFTSIDDDRLGQVAKVRRERAHEIIVGDAMQILPGVVDRSPGERIAILIDGPKGRAAVGLALEALRRQPKVAFVAVHDLAFAGEEYLIDSHNLHFRKEFGFLDAGVGEALTKHPNGPGLSVFR